MGCLKFRQWYFLKLNDTIGIVGVFMKHWILALILVSGSLLGLSAIAQDDYDERRDPYANSVVGTETSTSTSTTVISEPASSSSGSKSSK